MTLEDSVCSRFFSDFPRYSVEDRQRFEDAWKLISKDITPHCRDCGEPYMEHPLRVARILAALNMDTDTLICALLHGSPERLGITDEQIESKFGSTVKNLVAGVNRISGLTLRNKTIQQAESIRKMFFAMIDDIRILLVRLADRLDKMRYLKHMDSEEQKRISQETIDIWAPLANRLGMSSVKDELEDLSLKFLNREVFDQIKALVAAKKGERSDFLKDAEQRIIEVAQKTGIKVEVNSRAKHFWSIYQKMKKRNKSAEELYDLLALRILTTNHQECYTMLGLVHTIWKPLDGRFKDYIAMPKPNGYQSLHTTVLCSGSRPLEIQIRTRDMHRIAENGVASHWLYKQGSTKEVVAPEQLSIINQLRELSKSGTSDEDYLARLKQDLLGDSIYVFTPRGDIIELPAGASAIDFAYYIHSAIGEKIVGAKADGAIIPLSQPLKNTQVVEILTHPQAHPTQNQYAGAHTVRARQRIRAWLAANDPAAAERKDLSPEITPRSAEQRGHHKGNPADAFRAAQPEFDSAVLKIKVGDTTNFLIKFAQCCQPVPPEPITGYVSRGRGIIIHRESCLNLERIPEIGQRRIAVTWELPKEKTTVTPKKKKITRHSDTTE